MQTDCFIVRSCGEAMRRQLDARVGRCTRVRRMLVLLGALGLLVSTTMIVRSADDSPEHSCKAYGRVSLRHVELDSRLFSIGGAVDEAELRRGCLHFADPVILPNCDAWESAGGMSSRRIGKVGPFYTDGTCDGSAEGTRLDDAPPEIIDIAPGPPG